MAKETDWNDSFKKDPEATKKELDDLVNGIIPSNVVSLEDHDDELKIVNELNKKHIFVNTVGGNSYITSKIYNEVTEREELEFLKIDTFKNIYSNRTIKDSTGKGYATIAVFWIGDSRRLTVDSVIFDPSSNERIVKRDDREYLNLWEGFSVEQKKGDWRLTKKHVYRVLCNSDHVKFKYVMRWLAWLVQNPDKRAEVALVFKGEKGAGKSFLFTQFKKIFGQHGMSISNPNRLTNKFNSHFRSLSFLFCDEVYYPGNKEIEGVIKAIITEEFIDIESKFKEPTTIRNRLHIVMCTNNEWVVPATKDERRYFIENISNMYAKGRLSDARRKKYFVALWNEMEQGGREAMLYDLMNYNLRGWHPREDVPETSELTRQKEMSLTPLHMTMKTMLEDAVFPGEKVKKGEFVEYQITSESLYGYFDKLEPKCAKFSAVRKSDLIKQLGAVKGRVSGKNTVKWEFPELDVMRNKWTELFGRVAWDEEDKWHIIKTDY